MRRLLVADSQGFYRSGLRSALEAAIPSLEVVEANSYEAMFSILEQRPIDLVLADPQMAGANALDRLKILHALYPCVRFALLAAAGRQHDVFKILAAGFSGFIFKSQTEEEIIGAISDILAGRIYIPPVQDEYPGGVPARVPFEAPAFAGPQPVFHEIDKLTPRQREVLALIAEGLSNKEIARRLHISEATTKIHAGALMRVLGVKNRTEAALLVQSLCIKLEDGEAPFGERGRPVLLRRP